MPLRGLDALTLEPFVNPCGTDRTTVQRLLELDRPSSAGLEKAAGLIKKVHSDLARVTEVTF